MLSDGTPPEMSTTTQRETPAADALLRIDAIASRFEAAWRSGERLSIEAALESAAPELRRALLEELLKVEVELRRAEGESPSVPEYRTRFAGDVEVVERAFGLRRHDEFTTVDGSIDVASLQDARRDVPDLSRYELLDRIGAGGMGEVYLARKRDRVDEHRLAIKMLRSSVGPDIVTRFLAEMDAMARLQHPHIVAILDSGSERDRPYFAMPHYPAGDLARALKRVGPLTPHTAAEYALAIAWAVRHLHERGIVHRDLKPSNILLDDYQDGRFPLGRPCVADFGLIKLLDSTHSASVGESLEGTVPYMSPEQASGRVAAVDRASDVWSIGVLLFEMIAGRRPFEGSTAADIRYRILNSEPPAATTAPRDLRLIVSRCLEKDPARRYADVGQLIEDLSAFLRAEPPPNVAPPGWMERIERWSRRRAALATRLLVVLVILANIWINRLADHAGLTGAPGRSWLSHVHFWTDQIILLTWAVASWLLQRRLDRPGNRRAWRAAWLTIDVFVVTILLVQVDAARTPLVAAYLALVAASGLWFDERLVAWTTGACVAGYVALAVRAAASTRNGVPVYEFLHYLTALTATGLLVTYMIHRARAVYRLYETRARR